MKKTQKLTAKAAFTLAESSQKRHVIEHNEKENMSLRSGTVECRQKSTICAISSRGVAPFDEGRSRNKCAMTGVGKNIGVRNVAFTLAETLIALAVIGIVAALTIPALITAYQEKELQTRYAKAKNRILNGYRLMMARQEIFEVQYLNILNNCNNMTEKACMSKEHREAFNIIEDEKGSDKKILLPNEYAIQGKEDKSQFSWDEVPYIFVTTDGMTYGILPDEELTSFSVVADTNGIQRPNTVGKDLYKFRYSGNSLIADVSAELEEVAVSFIVCNGDIYLEAIRARLCGTYATNKEYKDLVGQPCKFAGSYGATVPDTEGTIQNYRSYGYYCVAL